MPIIIKHHSLGDALGGGLNAYVQGRQAKESLLAQKQDRELRAEQLKLQKEIHAAQLEETKRQRDQSLADVQAGGAALDLMQSSVSSATAQAGPRPQPFALGPGQSGPLPEQPREEQLSDPDHAQAIQRVRTLLPSLSPKAQALLLEETQTALQRDALVKGARNFSTEIRHHAALGSYGEAGAQVGMQAADLLDKLAGGGDTQMLQQAMIATHKSLTDAQKDQAELQAKADARLALQEGIMQQAGAIPGGQMNPAFYPLAQLAAYAGKGFYDKDPTEAIEAAHGIAQGWVPYTNPKTGKAMYLPPAAVEQMQTQEQETADLRQQLLQAQTAHLQALAQSSLARMPTEADKDMRRRKDEKGLELADSQIERNKRVPAGQAAAGPGLTYEKALRQASSEVDWRKGVIELEQFSQRVKDLMEGKVELPGQAPGPAGQPKESWQAIRDRVKAAGGSKDDYIKALRAAGFDPDALPPE